MSVIWRYRGAMDEQAVRDLVDEVVEGVARSCGVSVQRLCENTNETPSLVFERRLAIELCCRIAGVAPRWIGERLHVSPRSFHTLRDLLQNALMKADPGQTIRVQDVCQQLRLPVPGSDEEQQWFVDSARAIWAAAAARAPLGADRQVLSIGQNPIRLRGWCDLAIDLCGRLPGMDSQTHGRVLGCHVDTCHRAARRLPHGLLRSAELRQADREISLQFRVPFRRESRKKEQAGA
jgi:hypothetical protein